MQTVDALNQKSWGLQVFWGSKVWGCSVNFRNVMAILYFMHIRLQTKPSLTSQWNEPEGNINFRVNFIPTMQLKFVPFGTIKFYCVDLGALL